MTLERSLDTSWFCSSVGLTQGAVAGLKGVSPRLGAKALTQLPVLLTLLCKKQWLRIFLVLTFHLCSWLREDFTCAH